MKYLVTGANGFLAKELKEYFTGLESKVELILTNRSTLDPTNFKQVENFFNNNQVDVVIHTAVKGGKRGRQDTEQDYNDNIAMFDNLSFFSDRFQIMFNFGSGAEFDRDQEIYRIEEKEIYQRCPKDFYGMSKNVITKKILDIDKNIFNIRLFGCFGSYEEEQRLIKATHNKVLNGQSPVIHQDKEMDFIYSKDVGRLISYITDNHNRVSIPKDINACYSQKYKISDIIQEYKHLTNGSFDVIIEEENGMGYSGCSSRFDSLGIKTIGLQKGIKECLTKWSKYYS